MPYHIVEHNNQYCVAPKGASTPIPDGCHDNRDEAAQHMAALYVNVEDAAKAGEPPRQQQVVAQAEQISGNLYRGESGQFQGGPGTILKNRLEQIRQARLERKRKKKGLRSKAKTKLTPEQRAVMREQQRTKNRHAVLEKLGLDKSNIAAAEKLLKGENVDTAAGDTLVKLGIAERAADGSYRMSSSGRQAVNAAGRGDAGMARDALSRSKDRQVQKEEREAKRKQREQEREQRRNEREKRKKERRESAGSKPKLSEQQETERNISSSSRTNENTLRGNIRRGLRRATKASGDDTYRPPRAARLAARHALLMRVQMSPDKREMMRIGLARARDLANGRAISLAVVRRMKTFFNRHQRTRPEGNIERTPWQMAYLGWGGDAGRAWANRIIKQANKES